MSKDFGSFSPCLSLFLLHKNISKITNLKKTLVSIITDTPIGITVRGLQCTDFFLIFKRKSLWGLANIQVIGAELNLYSSSANATCLLASFMYLIFISVYQQCRYTILYASLSSRIFLQYHVCLAFLDGLWKHQRGGRERLIVKMPHSNLKGVE